MAHRGRGRAPTPGRTVLLIDDDEDVARIMGEVLTHAGYEMLHAGSLADAKRLLEIAEPGVVVVEPYALGRRPVGRGRLPDRWGSAPPGRVSGADHAGRGGGAGPLRGVCALCAKPVSPRRVLEAIEAVISQRDAPPGARRYPEHAVSGERHRG